MTRRQNAVLWVLWALVFAFLLVPLWWWALFGLSREAGEAAGTTALILFILGLWFGTAWQDDAKRKGQP